MKKDIENGYDENLSMVYCPHLQLIQRDLVT